MIDLGAVAVLVVIVMTIAITALAIVVEIFFRPKQDWRDIEG